VGLCSTGEIKFHLAGTLFQIAGLLFEAYRHGLTIKLFAADEKLDPISFLYYFAPVSTVTLGVVAAFTEWSGGGSNLPSSTFFVFDSLGSGGSGSPVWSRIVAIGPWIFLANGLTAFFLNVVVVALVSRNNASGGSTAVLTSSQMKRTGPMTIPLWSIFRSVLVMLGSVMLWDTVITPLQVAGVSFTSAGLAWYYLLKASK
jgi:hypothetical protein